VTYTRYNVTVNTIRPFLLIACLAPAGCDRPRPEPTIVPAPVASSSLEVELADARTVQPQHCPWGMVLVEGDYCPRVQQDCLKWADDPPPLQNRRCLQFARHSTCLSSQRQHMRFCIDREEHSPVDGGLPLGHMSWTASKALCESQGKRLCQEREWTFACEGEDMLPYPYGYRRDPTYCNFDVGDLVDSKGQFRDQALPNSDKPYCLSPFGVHNMVGNRDEWVVLDRPHFSRINNNRKMMSGLKSGWWGAVRARCRATTVDHDELYQDVQTGCRCCRDAK
jgi:sulfatase modifying factor 1